MPFGERLRAIREDRDITQKALAAVIGVSPRMVSFYESGAHFPRDESILIKLADFFQVSVDYLLGHSSVSTGFQQEQLVQMIEGMSPAERENLMQYADFLMFRRKQGSAGGTRAAQKKEVNCQTKCNS